MSNIRVMCLSMSPSLGHQQSHFGAGVLPISIPLALKFHFNLVAGFYSRISEVRGVLTATT